MRRLLLATAVALGPLLVATGAMAETVISNASTTPVLTSTTHDDVRVAVGGSITLGTATTPNTAAPAIHVDTDNKATVQGTITVNAGAVNGGTGIQIDAGRTTTILNSGTIVIDDNYLRGDAAPVNGFPDGPWAQGANRFGIHGMGDITGDVTNDGVGVITVHGNTSAGIAIDGTLTGNFTNAGVVNLTGDNGFGVHLHGVNGAITFAGSVNVAGAASNGIQLDGDVTGKVVFRGAVNVGGYSVTTHPTSANAALLLPSEMQQGGTGVVIAGNMANGVTFDGAPTASTTNTDVDGDGVLDTTQATSIIIQNGAAPALAVGSGSKDITLGVVGTTVTASAADYNYGLLLKGSINSNGVFDTITSTAIQIGDFSGNGHLVTIDGGIRQAGSVFSTSFEATSIAMQIGANVSTPVLRNDGSISATATLTTPANSAIGILLNSQSNVPTLTNSGAISGTVIGSTGQAYGILDFGGSLTDIENRGAIVTNVGPDPADPNTTPADELTARSGVAIEASNNTSGLMVHQFKAATADSDPFIVGAIHFGSGADTLKVDAGQVIGDINFGTATAGADSLQINGSSAVQGKILDGDGKLTIAINDGTLLNQNTSQLNIASLSVGNKGTLITTIDPTTAAATGLNVSGGATLVDGATLGTRFTTLLQASAPTTQFTLIQTAPGALTIGAGVNLSSVTTNTPYLFVVTPETDQVANGRLYIQVARRTAAQAGMTPDQAAAFNPVYLALGSDTALQNAFLNQTTQAGFFSLYNQLLPDHSGAQLFSLSSGVDAVSRALGDRRPTAEPGENSGWVQEINFYAKRDTGSSFGFQSNGFGVASGVERGSGLGAVGVSLAFTSADQKDPFAQGDENLSSNLVEAGLYWRANGEHWRGWARAAAGYAWLDSVRQFIYIPSTTTTTNNVVKKASSNWTGYTATAAGGLSYEVRFGRYFVRPEVNAEYFYLSEGAHDETGGGPGFDLSLGKRTGHLFSASAMLNVGGKFGPDGWLQPEIHLGWRDNVSVDAGNTTAMFRNVPGATPFSLTSGDLAGGGPVVGFRILANGGMGFLALEGDADLMKMYKRYQLMIRAGYRF
jgi:hypothetical protein